MKDLCGQPQKTPGDGREAETGWDGWFVVPGDMDDFIFFGEQENTISER